MGCVVNGPGEAKEADLGIAGGKGVGVLFRKGKIVRKIQEKDFSSVLLREIKELAEGLSKGA
jgi:(E)-4-hydroxy-3-methylbut-2-enyl-diphosphate synthase